MCGNDTTSGRLLRYTFSHLHVGRGDEDGAIINWSMLRLGPCDDVSLDLGACGFVRLVVNERKATGG